METIILIIHVLAAVAIIGLVLLQQGKGADVGASFGAGASQTLFGSQGSGSFLTRLTTGVALLFFVTSFALAYMSKQKAEELSRFGDVVVPVEQSGGEVAELPAPEDVIENEDEMLPALPEERGATRSEVPAEAGNP